MIRTSGATWVYRSIRPATADERQGARPPAVSMATVVTGMGKPIRTLVVLVHPMLKQVRPNTYRSRCYGRFQEKHSKPGSDRQHRCHEQSSNLGAEMCPAEVGSE